MIKIIKAPAAPIVIIEAPLAVEAHDSGVAQAPDALRRLGLHEQLGSPVVATLGKADWVQEAQPGVPLLCPDETRAYLDRLAASVAAALQSNQFPLVLGGDCSILLGCLHGLRLAGHEGLLFVDGHMDYYQAGQSPDLEVASHDLALATGHGPASLTRFGEFFPLVNEGAVSVFGFRDKEIAAESGGMDIYATQMLVCSLEDIRYQGFHNAVGAALAPFLSENRRFWLHLDVDVLDDAVMPAVDYRMPGGLGLGEADAVLRRALDTGLVMGMDVTIYNPTLDWPRQSGEPGGAAGLALAKLLAGVLTNR